MFQPAWTTLAAKRLHSGPTLEVVLGVHILSSPWSKTNVVYRPVCLLCKCQLPPMQEKQQKCTCGGNGRWILVTVYVENKISNLPPLKTFCPTLSQWPCTSRLKLRCSLCCPCTGFFFLFLIICCLYLLSCMCAGASVAHKAATLGQTKPLSGGWSQTLSSIYHKTTSELADWPTHLPDDWQCRQNVFSKFLISVFFEYLSHTKISVQFEYHRDNPKEI